MALVDVEELLGGIVGRDGFFRGVGVVEDEVGCVLGGLELAAVCRKM